MDSSRRPLAWREGAAVETDVAPLRGPIEQSDGRYAVVVEVPLGCIGANRLQALTGLAEGAGASGLVLTRDQNILVRDLAGETVAGFQSGVVAFGLDASGEDRPLGDVVACPGISTCAIGITASSALAADFISSRDAFGGLANVRLRISGCHNSCAQHHVADIGLHGVAKKIDGKNAPHYRIHVGGAGPAGAVAGPVIPAHQAKPAIKALLEALAAGRPVLSTTVGAEGIDAEAGKDLLIADSAEDLASEAARILSDAGAANAVGSAGQDLVRKRYDWKIVGETISARLELGTSVAAQEAVGAGPIGND